MHPGKLPADDFRRPVAGVIINDMTIVPDILLGGYGGQQPREMAGTIVCWYDYITGIPFIH